MADPNITEEVHFEILEKKADGSFKAKYPKVKSKSGVTFDEHVNNDTTNAHHPKNVGLAQCNFETTELPTQNDDKTKGYVVGSTWTINFSPEGVVYICTDNTAGKAKWETIADSRDLFTFYNAGFENENLTGGLVKSITAGGGSSTKLIDHIYIDATSNGNNTQHYYSTANKIDLSKISTLKLSVTDTSRNGATGGSFYLEVSTSIDGVSLARASTTKADIIELDVSSLEGEYYVRFGATTGNTNGAYIKGKITKAWGEKQ